MLVKITQLYLETILILKNQNEYVRSIDIAHTMDFSKPSVSRAIKLLKESQLIVVDDKGYIDFTELNDKDFSHTLWQMCTECIVVFPEGVGVLPWMLCGTVEIGMETAKKMHDFRLVIWAMHGVYASGETMDETFGLIETVEKAAQIYMLISDKKQINTITDNNLIEIAEFFKVNYRKEFLN